MKDWVNTKRNKLYLEEDEGCDGYYQIVALPVDDIFCFRMIIGTHDEIDKYQSIDGAMILPNRAYHRCDYEAIDEFNDEIQGFKKFKTSEDLENYGFKYMKDLDIICREV